MFHQVSEQFVLILSSYYDNNFLIFISLSMDVLALLVHLYNPTQALSKKFSKLKMPFFYKISKTLNIW